MEAEYYGWRALAHACADDEAAAMRAAEKAEELSARIEVRALSAMGTYSALRPFRQRLLRAVPTHT